MVWVPLINDKHQSHRDKYTTGNNKSIYTQTLTIGPVLPVSPAGPGKPGSP